MRYLLGDHGIGHRRATKFCLVKGITPRIFSDDVELAIGFGNGIIIVIATDFLEGLLETTALVLADKELAAHFLEGEGNKMRVEVLGDVAVKEELGIHDVSLRPVAEDVFEIKQGELIADSVMGFLSVALVVDGGLLINADNQVLKADEHTPIDGLFAVGNVSGCFYGGVDYPMDVLGLSIGRAITGGYLAGKHVAAL